MPHDASRRGRVLIAVAALALGGCALGLATGSLGAEGARADASMLNITYTTPTSLQVMLGNGTVVGSGTVIPAGSYTVSVKDDPNTGDLNPDLTISGPGVSVSNNLNSTGMGIDATTTLGPYTFQTSSSYSIEDTNVGASTLVTFTTTATASASTGSTSSSASTPTGPTQTPTATTSSSSAGARARKTLGTLRGSVGAASRPTLTFDGSAVKTLKPGLYTLTVEDQSRKQGLILGEGTKRPTTLSGAATVGKSSHTLSLSAGRWFFEASTHGPKTYFDVSK